MGQDEAKTGKRPMKEHGQRAKRVQTVRKAAAAGGHHEGCRPTEFGRITPGIFTEMGHRHPIWTIPIGKTSSRRSRFVCICPGGRQNRENVISSFAWGENAIILFFLFFFICFASGMRIQMAYPRGLRIQVEAAFGVARLPCVLERFGE